MEPSSPRHAICLASDQNYIDYAYVTVLSIADHSSPEHQYEIVILGNGILEYKKQLFYRLNSKNLSVSFIDMEKYIDSSKMQNFFTSGHITMASYFRYFIPSIFKDYNKVIYVDTDTIIRDDIYKIFSYNIDNYMLGVVNHPHAPACASQEIKNYRSEVLHIIPDEYFNAGVLLYNIQECRRLNLFQKCFELQKLLENPPSHDQDVLNSAAFKKTFFLPSRWNFMVWALYPQIFHRFKTTTPELFNEFMLESQHIAILHFGSAQKPWTYPKLPFADLWWQIARRTPFYERFLADISQHQVATAEANLKKYCSTLSEKQNQILATHRKETLAAMNELKAELIAIKQATMAARSNILQISPHSRKRGRIKFRYILYRFLSKVTCGKLRKKFLAKRHKLKSQLNSL